MYKPDEDIDRLSRDAAEHYNAPGKPSWDALQQILDKELPQEKEKKRRGFFFFFWLLLGLSVAGTGIWYGITINNKTQKTTLTDKTALDGSKEKPTIADQPEAANTTSSKDKTTEAGNTTASNNVSAKTETTAPDPKTTTVAIVPGKGTPANTITEKKIKPDIAESKTAVNVPAATVTNAATGLKDNKNKTAASGSGKSLLAGKKIKGNTTLINGEAVIAANKQQSANTKPTRIKVGNQNLLETGGSSKSTAKKNKRGGKKGSSDNTNPPDGAANEILTGIAANNKTGKTRDNTDITDKSDDQNQPVTTMPDTAANKTLTNEPVAKAQVPTAAEKKDSVVVAKKKTKTKPKAERAINFGILAGIDKSTVKFTNGANAGYNIGLTGGYQFSKHWSVSTGVIYTKKNYALKGTDFHPPQHYWTQYVDLQSVEGYCKMWEIPLQARYTFNPGAKTAFFASTGLSSYFMTRQYYDYSYKNNMGWPMTGAWSTDSTFRHVFSILDLSVGFGKNIGKHMNLQVEPYAKIPLGGVGFGNIRLSSFGINFSIQYKHSLKR